MSHNEMEQFRGDIRRWMLKALTTVGITAAVQLFGAVWFISGLSAEVKHLRQEITEVKASLNGGIQYRYTSIDASRDKELIQALITSIEMRVARCEMEIENAKNRQ
jgi:hypothetical protein